MTLPCCRVDSLPVSENRPLFSTMTLGGRDELDATMPMVFVVPAHEGMHLLSCRRQAFKGLGWVGWRVLQRSEQALRVRIVVAHRGAAE